MCDQKIWTDWLAVGLAPITAIATIFFAWRQFEIERRRDRREAYDRRHQVFAGVVNFIRAVNTSSTPQNSDLVEFVDSTSEAPFLFSDSIKGYLDELYKNAVELQIAERSLGNAAQVESDTASRKVRELSKWWREQYDAAISKFKPEMSIK